MYLQCWHGWCYMKLLPSRHKFCVHHTTMSLMQSHILKVCACLAVTCHLHFGQNDRDLLRATAVTWGWNGYWNKSQRRKLTLEKKILPPLLQGFEPLTFQSWVRRSNHWAIPPPNTAQCTCAAYIIFDHCSLILNLSFSCSVFKNMNIHADTKHTHKL